LRHKAGKARVNRGRFRKESEGGIIKKRKASIKIVLFKSNRHLAPDSSGLEPALGEKDENFIF